MKKAKITDAKCIFGYPNTDEGSFEFSKKSIYHVYYAKVRKGAVTSRWAEMPYSHLLKAFKKCQNESKLKSTNFNLVIGNTEDHKDGVLIINEEGIRQKIESDKGGFTIIKDMTFDDLRKIMRK